MNTSLRFSTSACPIGEFSCTRPLPPAASDETHLGSAVPLIVHIIPLILCGMIEKKALSAVTQLRQTLPTRLYVCLGRKRLIGDGRAGQVEFPAAGYNWGLFGTCSPFVRGQCLLMSWDEVLRAFKERLHHAAVHQIQDGDLRKKQLSISSSPQPVEASFHHADSLSGGGRHYVWPIEH